MEITGSISDIKDNHFSFQNSQIAKKGCQQKSWQPFLSKNEKLQYLFNYPIEVVDRLF